MKKRLVVAAVSGAAALLAMSAQASASKVKAPLEEAAGCAVSAKPGVSVGTAKLTRVGEAVTVKVVMKAGLPNSEYGFALQRKFPDGHCEGLEIGFFMTNKKGKGKATVTVNRPLSETEFVLAVLTLGALDTSPLISLP